MSVHLSEPFEISPRLLPALNIGGAWVQLEYSNRDGREGRVRYRWTIDLPDGSEHSDDDLQSGAMGGGDLLNGFESLLGFLGAAAESYRYRVFHLKEDEPDEDSNEGLFPPAVTEWAYQNSDDIAAFEEDIRANIEACDADADVTPMIWEQ